MLKSLHLKNWRSIREATIEFSPITVLIGANASGKTNILDALYFLRDVAQGIDQAIYIRNAEKKIRNLNAMSNELVSLQYTYTLEDFGLIIDNFDLKFLSELIKFQATRIWSNDNHVFMKANYRYQQFVEWEELPDDQGFQYRFNQKLGDYLHYRWQFLGENFMPPLTRSFSTKDDLYAIESLASNAVIMLDNMQQTRPELYESLQEDLRFLLGHVSHISPKRREGEVQIAFHENKYPDKEAPTVSAGTARILAVLAAVYALDMRNPEMSGLVVIEEPETSLNPSLLRKFVEFLRGYTEDEKKPRQFILTTHNPAFLNHFEPEEVRVVSRDEDGNTVVNPIPDYVREIWLPEHDLGDVWLTNAFGGVAE